LELFVFKNVLVKIAVPEPLSERFAVVPIDHCTVVGPPMPQRTACTPVTLDAFARVKESERL
jgi:hypothetical protein